MRASVQGGRGQLLSITGRRGAPSPSDIDGRFRILNNITRLHLKVTHNTDDLPARLTVSVMKQNLVSGNTFTD